jgi:hypothetical protein
VSPVYSKIPVETGFMQSRDVKTVPKACKIGLSLPNLTLPVNNTVKEGRIDLEKLKLFRQRNRIRYEYRVSERIRRVSKGSQSNELRGFVVKERNCSGRLIRGNLRK